MVWERDYANSNITGGSVALKFGNAIDYLQSNFIGVANTISYQLRGNAGAGAWNGTFTTIESQDGVLWTTIRTITGSGAILLMTTGTTFSDNPLIVLLSIPF